MFGVLIVFLVSALMDIFVILFIDLSVTRNAIYSSDLLNEIPYILKDSIEGLLSLLFSPCELKRIFILNFLDQPTLYNELISWTSHS